MSISPDVGEFLMLQRSLPIAEPQQPEHSLPIAEPQQPKESLTLLPFRPPPPKKSKGKRSKGKPPEPPTHGEEDQHGPILNAAAHSSWTERRPVDPGESVASAA